MDPARVGRSRAASTEVRASARPSRRRVGPGGMYIADSLPEGVQWTCPYAIQFPAGTKAGKRMGTSRPLTVA